MPAGLYVDALLDLSRWKAPGSPRCAIVQRRGFHGEIPTL